MKILKTYDFVSERIKVQPITNAELDVVQDEIAKQTKNVDSPKTYYTLTASSRYIAKWWVKYYDENGELKAKGFPVRYARDTFISQLEEQGYICDKSQCK